MSDETKRRRGNEPQETDEPRAQKKPSGHQFEIKRRENLAKQKEADRLRAGYFAEKIKRAPAVPGPPERAHLRMLERLERQACDIENDPGLSEEDRRKAMNETAHAMAKISANAECEREAEELVAVVHRERDANLEYRRKLQLDAKKHLCPECGAKVAKKEKEET